MKIAKNKLRKLILQEVQSLLENPDAMGPAAPYDSDQSGIVANEAPGEQLQNYYAAVQKFLQDNVGYYEHAMKKPEDSNDHMTLKDVFDDIDDRLDPAVGPLSGGEIPMLTYPPK